MGGWGWGPNSAVPPYRSHCHVSTALCRFDRCVDRLRVARTELDSQLRHPEGFAVLHANIQPGGTPDDLLDALTTALQSFARGEVLGCS